MRTKIIVCIVVSIGFLPKLFSQEKVTTFGVQLKPIVPINFFGAGKLEKTSNNVQYINQPKFGLSFGMVIRRGLTKSLSIETGLNFLKRNFDLTINSPDSSFSRTSDFSIVNYEIPVLGMVYVRLGRQMFMNVAGGFSFDIYPTPLFTSDDYFTNAVNRKAWLQPSLIANIGWEYRTEKSGYIYFGASLHRSFNKAIFREFVAYTSIASNGDRVIIDEETFDLTGNYLTIDIRYFFHEDKQKKKKKVKKEKVKRKFIDPRKK